MARKRRRPWPLAPRQALLSLRGFHPAEAAGLYTEPVPPGFESSIVKLEQRLAWSAALETCRDAAWKLAHLPPGQPFTVMYTPELQPVGLLDPQYHTASILKADAFL